MTRQIILLIESLDAGWLQHNTDAVSHSLWWQVLGELCADDAGVTMGTSDLAPDSNSLVGGATWSAALVQLLVDIANTLAEVEVGVGAVRAALNLEESSVLVLVAETTSVTDEDRFSVKTAHGQLFLIRNGLLDNRNRTQKWDESH